MTNSILTIDDSKAMRQMIRFTLSNAGYEVVEAENGQDGLEKLSQHAPKLVICDVNMPVMNGFEFVQSVRASTKYCGLPIIMLTSESAPEKKAQAKAAGATGWITKPFKEATLLALTKKLAG